MKKFLAIMAGLFVVSVGVVAGTRMSVDAMAVIIGVVFGLVATIPTTVLLVFVLRQRENQQEQYFRQQTMAHQQYPPVVVVNSPPNGGYYGSGGSSFGGPAMLPAAAGERSFKVVGQDASSAGETLSEAFNLSSIWDDGV